MKSAKNSVSLKWTYPRCPLGIHHSIPLSLYGAERLLIVRSTAKSTWREQYLKKCISFEFKCNFFFLIWSFESLNILNVEVKWQALMVYTEVLRLCEKLCFKNYHNTNTIHGTIDSRFSKTLDVLVSCSAMLLSVDQLRYIVSRYCWFNPHNRSSNCPSLAWSKL